MYSSCNSTRSAVTAGRVVRGCDPILLHGLDADDSEMNDRYYERFTDHAVSVARRATASGRDPLAA